MDAEVEAMSLAYEQLEQQHKWAMERQMYHLAAAYEQGMAYLASKLVDLTMGAPL